jgi:hypothetical protein
MMQWREVNSEEPHHVAVRNSPAEGPELHDRYEATQIEHLPLQVLAMAHAAEIE